MAFIKLGSRMSEEEGKGTMRDLENSAGTAQVREGAGTQLRRHLWGSAGTRASILARISSAGFCGLSWGWGNISIPVCLLGKRVAHSSSVLTLKNDLLFLSFLLDLRIPYALKMPLPA